MEVGKISEGIQATIELLESIPIRGRAIEVAKEATVRAENGCSFAEPSHEEPEKEDGGESE